MPVKEGSHAATNVKRPRKRTETQLTQIKETD